MFEFQRTQITENCEYFRLNKCFPKLLMCKAEALHERVTHTDGHEWKDVQAVETHLLIPVVPAGPGPGLELTAREPI